MRDAEAKPVLFSPFRFAGEVKRVASRHGVEYFTLPTEPEAFGQIFLIGGDRFLNVLPARLHIVLDGFVMPQPYRNMPGYLKRNPPLSLRSVASDGTE